MTVQVNPSGGYQGLSSDSKPTTGVSTGDKFLELDTGDAYIWNGSIWVQDLVDVTPITGSVDLDPGAEVLLAAGAEVDLAAGAEVTVNGPVDDTTGALLQVPYEHHEIHEGSNYFVKGWVDVTGAGTNTDFLFVVPDTAKWPHAIWELAGEGEFTLSLYEGVVTSGTPSEVPSRNSNRNSLNTAGVKVYSSPTLAGGTLGDGNQGGTLIWAGKIGSGKTATESRATIGEMIAKQNTKYWFRLTHIAAGTEWLDYFFSWYEHTNLA